MKLNIKKNTKRIVLLGALSLAIIGLSTGIAFKMHPNASAAGTQAATSNDGETKDDNNSQPTAVNQDNGNDGETKDNNSKSVTGNVQDNGQDGETNDSATQ